MNIRKTISLVLKAITVFAAMVGTYLSAAAGKGSFMGGSRVFMYFTIQSNLVLALICIIGAIKLLSGKKTTVFWSIIKHAGTVSITLTGAVFCFVLAPTFGPAAWNLQNILTHVVSPICAVLDFLVVGRLLKIRRKDNIYVIVPPILYAIYAGIGFILNWEFSPGANYPYFFLNWGSPLGAFGFSRELPFMGCVWWILMLLVMLLIVGRFYQILVKRK